MLRRRRRTEPPAEETPPVPAIANPEDDIDWAQVPERLRPILNDALDAYDRWRRIVDRQAAGPIRVVLTDRTERIAAAVRSIHASALRIRQIDETIADLDPDRLLDRLKAARRAAAEGAEPVDLAAVEASFRSMQSMQNAAADAVGELRALEARLDAAVAGAADLVLVGEAAPSGLGTELDDLVTELDHLGDALRSL